MSDHTPDWLKQVRAEVADLRTAVSSLRWLAGSMRDVGLGGAAKLDKVADTVDTATTGIEDAVHGKIQDDFDASSKASTELIVSAIRALAPDATLLPDAETG